MPSCPLTSTVSYLPDRYVRHSESLAHYTDLHNRLLLCRGLVLETLDPETRDTFSRLSGLASPQSLEAARADHNRAYLARAIPRVQETVQRTSSAQLTDEQAKAVATDEDATLVIAGAGTGKTAVIVGKSAHLGLDLGVAPESVLVLAYNRKAALEVRERLPEALKGAHVSTFHSFGRHIIAQAGRAPMISRLATDDRAFTTAINAILAGLMHSDEYYPVVLEFIAYCQTPYRSVFDFDDREGYEGYLRGVELRTLSGDLVKSYEEVVVANFLTEQGVRFEYEAPYAVDTADREHRQYQPDFYLPAHNIYLEHFALDRNGRPPPGWDGYAEGVAWKRQIHERYKTHLIETYSWYQSAGILRSQLQQILAGAGVSMNPQDGRDLVRQLAQQQVLSLSRLMATFLTQAKTAGLSVDQLPGPDLQHCRSVPFGVLSVHLCACSGTLRRAASRRTLSRLPRPDQPCGGARHGGQVDVAISLHPGGRISGHFRISHAPTKVPQWQWSGLLPGRR